MILKKILGVILVLAGLILAAGGIYVSFASLDAEPVLISEPVEASGRVTELMDAIVACDYEKASSVLYGNPQLGLDREPADEVGVMLWDAFVKSQSYELKGGCVADHSGLTQQVVMTYLDLSSVTENLAARSQAVLMQRIDEAENIDEIYDENNEYREDVVMDALKEAVTVALKEDAKQTSVELTLNLIYRNKQWWVVSNSQLINAISGGIMH